jgi:hypothetical protein
MDTRQQHIMDYEATVVALQDTTACEDKCYEEASHVFKCMQCDLQFQMDTAVMKGESVGGIDEIVRVRVDPAYTS